MTNRLDVVLEEAIHKKIGIENSVFLSDCLGVDSYILFFCLAGCFVVVIGFVVVGLVVFVVV